MCRRDETFLLIRNIRYQDSNIHCSVIPHHLHISMDSPSEYNSVLPDPNTSPSPREEGTTESPPVVPPDQLKVVTPPADSAIPEITKAQRPKREKKPDAVFYPSDLLNPVSMRTKCLQIMHKCLTSPSIRVLPVLGCIGDSTLVTLSALQLVYFYHKAHNTTVIEVDLTAGCAFHGTIFPGTDQLLTAHIDDDTIHMICRLLHFVANCQGLRKRVWVDISQIMNDPLMMASLKRGTLE